MFGYETWLVQFGWPTQRTQAQDVKISVPSFGQETIGAVQKPDIQIDFVIWAESSGQSMNSTFSPFLITRGMDIWEFCFPFSTGGDLSVVTCCGDPYKTNRRLQYSTLLLCHRRICELVCCHAGVPLFVILPANTFLTFPRQQGIEVRSSTSRLVCLIVVFKTICSKA